MSVEGTARGGAPGALGEGSVFGGFRIERTLGHGGMGIVYLATELRLDRQVALKVIRTELAGDEDFRARFRSESRTAAASPSISRVSESRQTARYRSRLLSKWW